MSSRTRIWMQINGMELFGHAAAKYMEKYAADLGKPLIGDELDLPKWKRFLLCKEKVREYLEAAASNHRVKGLVWREPRGMNPLKSQFVAKARAQGWGRRRKKPRPLDAMPPAVQAAAFRVRARAAGFHPQNPPPVAPVAVMPRAEAVAQVVGGGAWGLGNGAIQFANPPAPEAQWVIADNQWRALEAQQQEIRRAQANEVWDRIEDLRPVDEDL